MSEIDPGVMDEVEHILCLVQPPSTTPLVVEDWNRLRAAWADRTRDDAREALQGLPASGRTGAKLLGKMMREIGYRARLRSDVPVTDPGQVLGHDLAACTARINVLAQQATSSSCTVFTTPSQADNQLVGRPAYPGACSPNPYQWIPAISRWSKPGGTIWEIGPGYTSSSAGVANVLGREVAMAQPPAPPADQELILHRALDADQLVSDVHGDGFRWPAPARACITPPSLVLVPLPLALDTWSVQDFIRGHGLASGQGQGLFPTWGPDILVRYPEFALTIRDYLQAAISRLQAIGAAITKKFGQALPAKVAVALPNLRGIPSALHREIRRQLRWTPIHDGQMAVVEALGTRHRGNGSGIPGVVVTVWEIRP